MNKCQSFTGSDLETVGKLTDKHTEVARDLVSYFVRWCSAVNVKTFEQLGDLVVLEQFKNIVPEHLATFINEHKVKTATEAAILSDEYALTHKGKSKDYVQNRHVNHTQDDRLTNGYNSGPAAKQDFSNRNKTDLEKCNYCLEHGHAKGQGCAAPVHQFNRKISQVNRDQPEGTASEGGKGCEVPDHPVEGLCLSESAVGDVGEGYDPFITDGFISFVGSFDKKPGKILRDTGATETFVLRVRLAILGSDKHWDCCPN